MKGKVLLIQENLVLLYILKKLVLSLGYKCDIHENITEIVEKVGFEYDIVITDVLFEGIASLEYIALLKEQISFQKIFILSDMEISHYKHAIESILEIDGFFETPFDINDLKKKLEEVKCF